MTSDADSNCSYRDGAYTIRREETLAGVLALQSLGESIVELLADGFQANPPGEMNGSGATFAMISADQMAAGTFRVGDNFSGDRVSLLLHRVTISEHMRSARPQRDRGAPLPLNLHFLVTVWASNPATEATLFAWTLRMLHDHPILDASSLTPAGEWAPDEVVHLIPDDISTEDMMRIWGGLTPSYRLSFSYVARVVRVDSANTRDEAPVLSVQAGLEQV